MVIWQKLWKLSEETSVDLGCIVTLSVDICTAASHYTFKKLFLIGITIVIHTNTLNVSFFLHGRCPFLYWNDTSAVRRSLVYSSNGKVYTPSRETTTKRFWCRLIIHPSLPERPVVLVYIYTTHTITLLAPGKPVLNPDSAQNALSAFTPAISTGRSSSMCEASCQNSSPPPSPTRLFCSVSPQFTCWYPLVRDWTPSGDSPRWLPLLQRWLFPLGRRCWTAAAFGSHVPRRSPQRDAPQPRGPNTLL